MNAKLIAFKEIALAQLIRADLFQAELRLHPFIMGGAVNGEAEVADIIKV